MIDYGLILLVGIWFFKILVKKIDIRDLEKVDLGLDLHENGIIFLALTSIIYHRDPIYLAGATIAAFSYTLTYALRSKFLMNKKRVIYQEMCFNFGVFIFLSSIALYLNASLPI